MAAPRAFLGTRYEKPTSYSRTPSEGTYLHEARTGGSRPRSEVFGVLSDWVHTHDCPRGVLITRLRLVSLAGHSGATVRPGASPPGRERKRGRRRGREVRNGRASLLSCLSALIGCGVADVQGSIAAGISRRRKYLKHPAVRGSDQHTLGFRIPCNHCCSSAPRTPKAYFVSLALQPV
ncbi:hypothetical protein FKP32DRAFT_133160 [Trametes sanguinea]|nr:hypothetical protein FKP32DRAFT_133160 [Trametes sanguinea]